MISRRKLLTGAAALAAYSVLPPRPAAAAANVIAGAIRWDAWYSPTGPSLNAQGSLGPSVYQSRAPWFCSILNAYQIQCTGTQAIIDTEIRCGANAGLKYFGFGQYDPNSGNVSLTTAWTFYQSSAVNNLINWCWVVNSDSLMGSTGNFSAQVAQYVAWFQQSNYQKVLTNRPLIYLNFNSLGSGWGASEAVAETNFKTMLSALRSATTGAGLGSPYIVVMSGGPATFMNAISADAVSAYLQAVPAPAQPASFSALTASVENAWNAVKVAGTKFIPACVSGWDRRPRVQNPVPWEPQVPYAGLLNYTTPATPSQIAGQLQDAVTFVGSNPTVCETTAIIIYNWDECDEGGGALIPTQGDPLQAGNTSNLLTAIGAVLN